MQDDLNSFNVAVDEVIGDQERAILRLALNSDVQQLVTNQSGDLNSALCLWISVDTFRV